MALELADIFRQYGPAYRQKYASRMPSTHFKAMRAVEECRTPALGGQVYRCPNCEQVQYSYHSCRNRHCPKCQNENAQIWLGRQQDLLLPGNEKERPGIAPQSVSSPPLRKPGKAACLTTLRAY